MSLRGGSIGFGLVLALLWGFHTIGYFLPGGTYLYIASLCLTFFIIPVRMCLRGKAFPSGGSRCGIGLSMFCWLLGASLSAICHAGSPLVVITYCAVFLGSAAIYMALDGIAVTPRELEIGVGGLVVASMVPILRGLHVFWEIWGWNSWGMEDLQIMINAYLDRFKMLSYEDVTYGNTGNTAVFIVLVAPLFLWISVDRNRSFFIRLLCAATLPPLAVTVLVLQTRAAFITLFLACALIFGFKLGLRRYFLFAGACALILWMLIAYVPDITDTISGRLQPVVTLDASQDSSVRGRSDAIIEGIAIGRQHWLLGIGPGAGLQVHSQTSAHQLFVQQFMETGVLGMMGSLFLVLGAFWMFLKTLKRGKDDENNDIRFTLLIGPISYFIYGVLANDTFNIGFANVWAILVASMLALTPRIEQLSGSRKQARSLE